MSGTSRAGGSSTRVSRWLVAAGVALGVALEACDCTPRLVAAFEQNITPGAEHCEGPMSLEIARALRDVIAPQDGIGVRVVPGHTTRILVIVEFTDRDHRSLRSLSVDERREQLDAILAVLDEDFETQADEVAIALRGSMLYGAILLRGPRGAPTYDIQRAARAEVLDPFLLATPDEEPSLPELTLTGEALVTSTRLPPDARTRFVLHVPERTRVGLLFSVTDHQQRHGLDYTVSPGIHRRGVGHGVSPIGFYVSENAEILEVAELPAGDYTVVVDGSCRTDELAVTPCTEPVPFEALARVIESNAALLDFEEILLTWNPTRPMPPFGGNTAAPSHPIVRPAAPAEPAPDEGNDVAAPSAPGEPAAPSATSEPAPSATSEPAGPSATAPSP